MEPSFSTEEIGQLKRAAQMFEMILDSGAESREAYETLRDVYGKLRMEEEFKRVMARFADYLLVREDREGGIAQLSELARRYPDESQWRERLAALGAVPSAADPPAPEQDLESAVGEAEEILLGFDGSAGEPASGPGPRASVQREEMKAHEEMKADMEGADDPEKELQKSLRLGEMLVEQGVITRENVEAALACQRETGKPFGAVLVELGHATEADVVNCFALQAGVPYLPLELYEVQPEVGALLPASFAKRHRVVAVDVIATSVVVTIAGPLSPETKQELAALLDGRKVNYYISVQREIEARLAQLYPEP